MIITLFYTLSILSLIVGTAAIYLAMIESVPVSWLYYHYFIRKPLNWSILLLLLSWSSLIYFRENQWPLWTLPPIIIVLFALILTYKMHQEKAFPSVFFPEMSDEPYELPIEETMELAVITYEGIRKCYPLDYVIHHHIVNDRFGTKTVALTYCAMCHSIIPFDVTDIGPLFVASFKNSNMIVADKATKTFFQQATFQSLIGKLHPTTLTMIPFQIMTWSDVKDTIKNPLVVHVTKKDFEEFQLPIPGIWKKLIATEATPGLSSKNRDKTFPARTRVIGILEPSFENHIVYLKKTVLSASIIHNKELGFYLIAHSGTVNGYKDVVNGQHVIILKENNKLIDQLSETHWNMFGKYLSGSIQADLDPIAVSDEYWFSWKKFHEDTEVIMDFD